MKTKMPRILIVDDEESIRRSLRAYLEDEGFELITAESGEEGLKRLAKESVDAAIVDIRLPGMDGTRFIDRAHEMHPHMTFFICTGSVDFKPPKSIRVIGVGDENVFRKPLRDMDLLATTLERALKWRHEP
jgi:DNA-binding NtrC family response regulator